MEKRTILLVTGEPSGDINAAAMVRQLRTLLPHIQVDAVGGPALRDAGARILRDIKEFTAFGLFDVLVKLPRFFALRDELLLYVRTHKPAAVILVDFSGFNLRFAKAINNATRVIYYISPQVWASREGRLAAIKKFVRRMIVLFAFEEQWYRARGINATCVGSPLVDIVKPTQDRAAFLAAQGLDPSQLTLALLPGSRRQEITHILPAMLGAYTLLKKEFPGLQAVIARASSVDENLYKSILDRYNLRMPCIPARAYDCINAADYCLVASGTATLETALLEKPFSIIYRMSMLNYCLYRPQVRVAHIGMVNIVAGERIVPEFIQSGARAKSIAGEAARYLRDPALRQAFTQKLAGIRRALGPAGAAGRAAQIIAQDLTNEN
jgi:lipid-A-disaccharide synthase